MLGRFEEEETETEAEEAGAMAAGLVRYFSHLKIKVDISELLKF